MTTAPVTAGQSGRDGLTARIFRALYQEFDLRTINGTYVVVPEGTPGSPEPASATSPARSATTRARPLPRSGPGRTLLPRHQQSLGRTEADRLAPASAITRQSS
jgi:hypothetical protein